MNDRKTDKNKTDREELGVKDTEDRQIKTGETDNDMSEYKDSEDKEPEDRQIKAGETGNGESEYKASGDKEPEGRQVKGRETAGNEVYFKEPKNKESEDKQEKAGETDNGKSDYKGSEDKQVKAEEGDSDEADHKKPEHKKSKLKKIKREKTKGRELIDGGNQAANESCRGNIQDVQAGVEKTQESKKESLGEEKEEIEKPAGKKKKYLIPLGILLVLAAAAGCIYAVIAFSYTEKFLPGTWINGIDCTELTEAQVAGLLQDQLQIYHLEVTGRDHTSGAPGTLLGQVTAEDIHLTYAGDSEETISYLLAQQNVFTWLYRKLSPNTYSHQLAQGVSYDEESLKNIVKEWDACQAGSMIPPQDAYISEYSEKRNGYEIIPEVEGTKFDVGNLLELMNAAILSRETSLDLEAENCYEEPSARQEDAELNEAVETANKWLGAVINYDWNGAEIAVDSELLRDWITMKKTGPELDESAVEEFVKEQAEANDTYGKRRSFLTTLGVELSLPSGYYGWLTDQEAETKELIRLICEGRKVSREPVYASTARQKGMSDIGNSYVEADLTHQHLYLYEGGSIVFETDFVSGSMSSTPDCVTPEGVFGISYKTTNAVLRGANYETPVNYWMPFYGNYGMHDATWRSEFGGGIFIENGSHGCLNLPLDAAAAIYGHMSTGFPVICYYYQVDPLANQYEEENWDDNDDGE